MANSFNGQLWELDTVGATPQTTVPIKVKSVRWTGATTAGHVATLTDSKGNILWTSVASGANYVEAEIIERWWLSGFSVYVLQSGKIYLNVA